MGNLQSATSTSFCSLFDCFAVYQSFAKDIISAKRSTPTKGTTKISTISQARRMAEWGYTGESAPQHWHKGYPLAGGRRQSPIDIQPGATKFDINLAAKPLDLRYDANRTFKVVNNGKTFRVDIDAADYNLSGGPLDHKYQLVQFHAHWGSKEGVGAEHTIDGKQYDAEIHLVHWNTEQFKSVKDAIQSDRGIAVLGSFIKVGAPHAGFEKLAAFLKKVSHKNSEARIEGGYDPSCLLPANRKDYWTYEGSLTTPPCYESVTFILFKEPIEVSPEQMSVLRELSAIGDGEKCKGHGKLVDNFRPLCPLNGRIVKSSFHA